jgi:taurine--2-oxoglutarate transaminase
VESIHIFEDDDLVGRARRLGEEVIRPALEELAGRHPSVGEVRGLGCFFAIELVRDAATREPYVPFNASGAAAAPMNELVAACRERGVWPFAHFNRLHVAPPLVIEEDQLRSGIEAIDDALEQADAAVGR